MSDKELIINSLKQVNRRLRTNRLLDELTGGLAFFLLVPVIFKTWDLFSPFRGRTVAVVLGLWLVGVVIYIGSRLQHQSTLSHAAAAVDRKAALQDELTSAYWFATAKQTSQRSAAWIDLQIKRAAQRARSINVDSLYPRVVPKTLYAALALFLVLMGLNFAPFANNHNWMYMQAAPAFSLTNDEMKLLAETRKLLEQAEKLERPELAKKLEQIIQSLQNGDIDAAEALKQLDQLQDQLEEGNLDLDAINEGMDEMAKDLSASDETEDISKAMSAHDAGLTADELKKLADEVSKADPNAIKQIGDALEKAGDSANPAMQNVAQDMKNAASALSKQDTKGAQDALQQASKDMQDLKQKMDEQAAKNAAGEQLQSLQDSLRQRQQGGKSQPAGKGEQASNGEKGQKGQSDQGKGDNPDGSQGGGSPNGDEAGDAGGQEGARGQEGKAGQGAQAGGQGTGQNPSGAGNAPMDIMGAATKLNVQLEKEQLTGQHEGGQPQNLEEASKQERSKLDYRNVKSELSPAQKDVLNQDKIPFEFRTLIKNYFQAIQKPHGK